MHCIRIRRILFLTYIREFSSVIHNDIVTAKGGDEAARALIYGEFVMNEKKTEGKFAPAVPKRK